MKFLALTLIQLTHLGQLAQTRPTSVRVRNDRVISSAVIDGFKVRHALVRRAPLPQFSSDVGGDSAFGASGSTFGDSGSSFDFGGDSSSDSSNDEVYYTLSGSTSTGDEPVVTAFDDAAGNTDDETSAGIDADGDGIGDGVTLPDGTSEWPNTVDYSVWEAPNGALVGNNGPDTVVFPSGDVPISEVQGEFEGP